MPASSLIRLTLAALAASLLASCGSTSSRAPSKYNYNFKHGETAVVRNGVAIAPPKAPRAVKAAIAAGNRIRHAPYQYGGGRGRRSDYGFDCSGATSYVLRAAGVMNGYGTSSTFRSYGKSGQGDWINVWARDGHVFLTVAGVATAVAIWTGVGAPHDSFLRGARLAWSDEPLAPLPGVHATFEVASRASDPEGIWPGWSAPFGFAVLAVLSLCAAMTLIVDRGRHRRFETLAVIAVWLADAGAFELARITQPLRQNHAPLTVHRGGLGEHHGVTNGIFFLFAGELLH